MNITELARMLKITAQELRDKLPLLGFDIGQKAIKVDNRTAEKIISLWPSLVRQAAASRSASGDKNKPEDINQMKKNKEAKIPAFISVRNFAEAINLPVSKVLAELMKSGIFTSLNERIDFDTAAIIGQDLGFEILLDENNELDSIDRNNQLKTILGRETEKSLSSRPAIVVVMGHVDHGKTKLLDAIRTANVVDGEAGGITQHIGAYQVTHKSKAITFIDTPGHEAFTAMRNRGAKVADIAILVVAADDGVKPQTVEAFRIIEAAKIPFVVAINKIDKPEADIEKTKNELSSKLNILPEDWGGKIVCVPVSAKQHQGIEDLLGMIALTADLEAANIKANPEASASGTIIESRIDKGEGPVATVLIQNGTLRIGDLLCFDGKSYGKAKMLKNFSGKKINEATPGMPAKIIGLKISPMVGDVLQVGEGEKINFKKNTTPSNSQKIAKNEDNKDENSVKINLIIKSDFLGSGEAIEGSLAKIETFNVKINIIHKGLGNITEGDIARAEASQAQIIGFNVKLPPKVQDMAREKKINIKLYRIIYELLADLKGQIQSLVAPEIRRVDLGKLKVLAIFKSGKDEQIIGGKVIEGQLENGCLLEIADRAGCQSGKLAELQSAKKIVNLASAGEECGIKYEGSEKVKTGDMLNAYKEKKIVKKI